MRLRLFLSASLLGGAGGFLGSVAGAAFGAESLFVGGFLGGVLVAPVTAGIAIRRNWISQDRFWPTAAGAALGFVAAAIVAVNTLSSPIGPVLSTSLTGLGALVGASWRARPSVAR